MTSRREASIGLLTITCGGRQQVPKSAFGSEIREIDDDYFLLNSSMPVYTQRFENKTSPYWYCKKNISTCCIGPCHKCSHPDVLHCGIQDYNKNLTLLPSFCATYDEAQEMIEFGHCMYTAGNTYHTERYEQVRTFLTLPRDLTELNNFMCSEMFNRKGTLCGKCKDGYYPMAYSFDVDCVKCPSRNTNWWKFIVAAFVPLTIFLFLVLSCRINITSSNLYGFVWYCQMVYTPRLGRIFIITLRNKDHALFQSAVRYMGVAYGIWNLDFLRSLRLGICLETDNLQTQALHLAVGIYPLLLLALTYIVVEMYDRRFRLIVLIWRPFNRLFCSLRSKFLSKTSLIDAFATFFFLTNVKFLSAAFDLLAPVIVHRSNSLGNVKQFPRLYYDATVPYFGREHLPYAIPAIAVLIVFVLLPVLILALYPFSCFHKLLSLFPIRWHFLHSFVDAFHGCYKDGTQPGTCDCRWFVSGFFLVRLFLFLTEVFTPTLMYFPAASTILALFAILLIAINPFKDGHQNTAFVLLLAFFYTGCLGLHIADEYKPNLVYFFLTITTMAGIFPLVYISIIILHWIYSHSNVQTNFIAKFYAQRQGYKMLK